MYFWPFFLIDFVRYTIVGGIGVLRYLYDRHSAPAKSQDVQRPQSALLDAESIGLACDA